MTETTDWKALPSMDELRRIADQRQRDYDEACRRDPEYRRTNLPYKVITEQSLLNPVRRMRYQWLKENHPEELDLMMRANVLEEHLFATRDRFRRRYAKILDDLMEERHLKNRTDVIQAHPEITDQDRYYGLIQAQHDAEAMAIEEVVRSF